MFFFTYTNSLLTSTVLNNEFGELTPDHNLRSSLDHWVELHSDKAVFHAVLASSLPPVTCLSYLGVGLYIIGMQKENCGPEISELKCGKFSLCFSYVSHRLWRPQICFLVAKPKHAHSFEDECHGSRCINKWYTQSDHKIRQAGNKKTKKWAQFKSSYSEVK